MQVIDGRFYLEILQVTSFDIAGNSVVDYQICAKALEPGVYHVHTQLNVANVGPGLGPGQNCNCRR